MVTNLLLRFCFCYRLLIAGSERERERDDKEIYMRTMTKDYDYLLKVLLVGDSDVGKHEILSNLEDPSTESPFCSGNGKSSGASDIKCTLLLYICI